MLVAAARHAHGECAGDHSVFDPVPDACLPVIDTDRPHQTDTPHLIPAGHVQLESGVVGAVFPHAGADRFVALDDGYKVGLVDWLELDVSHAHVDYDRVGRDYQLDPLTVRAKLRLIAEAERARPAVSAVPMVAVGFSGPALARAGLGVFLGWELPADIELEADVGAYRDHRADGRVAATLLAASALTVPIAWRVHGYGEVFVYGPADDAVVTLGTGLLRPIGRDLQVDVALAAGVTGSTRATQLFLGFSLRL